MQLAKRHPSNVRKGDRKKKMETDKNTSSPGIATTPTKTRKAKKIPVRTSVRTRNARIRSRNDDDTTDDSRLTPPPLKRQNAFRDWDEYLENDRSENNTWDNILSTQFFLNM